VLREVLVGFQSELEKIAKPADIMNLNGFISGVHKEALPLLARLRQMYPGCSKKNLDSFFNVAKKLGPVFKKGRNGIAELDSKIIRKAVKSFDKKNFNSSTNPFFEAQILNELMKPKKSVRRIK